MADGSVASLYSLSTEGVGSAGAPPGRLTTTLLTEADCRGREGMKKLLGAANNRVSGAAPTRPSSWRTFRAYAGNGTPRRRLRGTTRGPGRTFTSATRPDRILDVSTLGALPSSRAVVMPSGTYPLVVRKVAWYNTERHREAVA